MWSATAVRPNWRERLVAWTGDPNWTPPTTSSRTAPYSRNSVLGIALQRVTRIRLAYERAARECQDQRDALEEIARENQNQQRTWIEGQIASDEAASNLLFEQTKTAAEIELEKQETTQKIGLYAALGIGAVALAFVSAFCGCCFAVVADCCWSLGYVVDCGGYCVAILN